MKIRLAEIPEDGRRFTFTRETGELNTALKDLIPKAPYRVEFLIRPLGNAYEMEGKIVTTMNELCSLCGWDLSLPLSKTFKEILIEETKLDRDAKHVHGNNSVDFLTDGPSTTPYRDGVFETDPYFHELIAISEPLYPSCEDPDCEHLEEARAKQAEINAEFERADEGTNPFAKLKSLGIKPKKN